MNKTQTTKLLLVFFLLLPFALVKGQDNKLFNPIDTTITTSQLVKDDFIVASLDSLANLKFFEGFDCASGKEIENIFGFLPGFVPIYADSVYYKRLKILDAATTIDLTYNQYVKDYIELYAFKKRALTERVMGLAQIYFPLFEEQLDRFNMPLELKYLAIVESALNPIAKSPVGASGLWQFMYNTGKAYNLNVSSLVDDRRDPLKATVAACQHMSDLYKMYHDWLLVLAAYNSGAGNVNKAIRRSGGKMTFWQIRPFLPLETRGYVPAFIAVNYIMSYAAEHNLRPVQPRFFHYEIDTVMVRDVLPFSQISARLNVPLEEIQFLNPAYKNGIIPATSGNPYVLRLQKKHVPDFVNNEALIYAYRVQFETEKEEVLSLMKTVTAAEYHKVRRGESLGALASKYHCTVTNLKKWNHMRSSTISVGQRLIVRPENSENSLYASAKQSTPTSKKVKVTEAKSTRSELAPSVSESKLAINETVPKDTVDPSVKISIENKYHKVKSGESLGRIADKYNASLADIRTWNKLRGNTIQPGQKLIVGKTEVAEQVAVKVSAHKTKVKQMNNDLEFIYYTVRNGDTLWKIAQQHEGASVDQIKKLNNISNDRSLKPGQKIKVGIAS